MLDYNLLLAVLGGVVVLLFLILRLKFQAFIALLISCIVVGLIAGMPVNEIISSIQSGMGGTLGFVATVVGLGALFGAMLEYSGGAKRLATTLIKTSGEEKAPWAVMIAGFLIAIPVFFDVAFIILAPVIYSLQKRTGKSLIMYAIPLLAGLAITHSFIPPTPGPIAVAQILNADLGWVILFGFITGVPTAIIAGPLLAKRLSKTMFIKAPKNIDSAEMEEKEGFMEPPSAKLIIAIIAVPIVLILLNTVLSTMYNSMNSIDSEQCRSIATFFETHTSIDSVVAVLPIFGHPFSALILANIIAWYLLGVRRKVSFDTLQRISTKALLPAGVIILLTGAGGAFKAILVDTGAGDMIASSLNSEYFPPVIFGFIVAAIVRVLQGSATVAMITAASLTSPLLLDADFSAPQLAVLVIAIASGATIFSHVNDSGFWLVKQYLGLTEKETFKSWTVMTSLIAVVGLVVSTLLWYLV